MTFEEHKEFPVESSSLKQIRNFALAYQIKADNK